MSEVKWIKLKVGMFDGESFKKIKRAKIGGESFRDKLTAIWFELMDFAGKCNHGGAFINSREIPYSELEDIAIMIDREVEELNLCMAFFIKEGMIEIIDDVYKLSNWAVYQNEAGLEKIRESNRIRQARYKERQRQKALSDGNTNGDNACGNVTDGVTGNVTECYSSLSLSNSNSTSLFDIEGKEKIEGVQGEEEKPSTPPAPPKPAKPAKEPPQRHKYGQYGWVLLSDAEYERLVSEYGKDKVAFAITYVDESAQTTGNKNQWKDWNLTVRRAIRDGWGMKSYGKQQTAPSQNQSKGKKSFQEILAERNGTA